MHYDVVIIGAGMSGLAAAIRLAQFGRSVCVVERHGMWGGLNSFYKKSGLRFDVGLHAVTNYLRPGYRGPRIPLQRIYRQLRISPEEFDLEPQNYSLIAFDDARLRFTNDLEVLTQQVRERFPAEIDGFCRLAERTRDYPDAMTDRPFVSTRNLLKEFLTDELLIDMILCPLLFYGSATENDVDFEQFIILFNSIYREGFCRPRRGVRQILEVLVKRLREAGGEIKRHNAVTSLIVKDDRVSEIALESGGPLTADMVLSSAGLFETEALRSDRVGEPFSRGDGGKGELSFIETIWVLRDAPNAWTNMGWDASITFFNRGPHFQWRRPSAPVDVDSGVICVPGNYRHREPVDEHLIRATHLADYASWFGVDRQQYEERKAIFAGASLARVQEIVGPFESRVTFSDMFTPKTVHKFTRHEHGAVYGAPKKVKSGRTDLANLFLCGTDQGMVGIVGAMLSGISIANAYVLSA